MGSPGAETTTASPENATLWPRYLRISCVRARFCGVGTRAAAPTVQTPENQSNGLRLARRRLQYWYQASGFGLPVSHHFRTLLLRSERSDTSRGPTWLKDWLSLEMLKTAAQPPGYLRRW